MRKSLAHIALAGLFLLGWQASSASAQTLLNEINANPPGTDQPCEYVEIRGAAGASLDNLYFVSFEGDGIPSGTADLVVNLTGRTLGSNGLLVIVSPTACPGRTIPAGTTQVTDAQFDAGAIENGTVSNLLISSATAIVEGTDYDADNNGSLEVLPANATIADAVGWSDGGEGDIVYGGVFLSQTVGAPNAATRFANSTAANSASAWYNGFLDSAAGSSSTVYSATVVSPNFPAGGALTPGAPNVGNFVPRKAIVDYNGDGRTDYSVVRNQSGQIVWYNSLNGTNEFRAVPWGLAAEDVLVPADYDGDQRDDIAVWRATGMGDPNRSFFYIIQSGTNTVRIEQFGRDGDDPTVVGDYDGDLRADLAVFRGNGENAQATWFYRPSGTAGANFTAVPWGLGLDIPATGDYDGDGKNDFVVQRDQGGQAIFFLLKSNGGNEAVQWGLGSDFVVPGDYDGDNQNDFCVQRPDSNGNYVFYVLTRTGAIQYFTFGRTGDEVVAGDYNGDGRSDIAVWRAGTGATGNSLFFVRPANSAAADIVYPWGLGEDVPVANFQVQ